MPTWLQVVAVLVTMTAGCIAILRWGVQIVLSEWRRAKTAAEIESHQRTEDTQKSAIEALVAEVDSIKQRTADYDALKAEVRTLREKVAGLEAQRLANAAKILADEGEIAGLKSKLAQAEHTAKRWQEYVLILVELMRAAGIAVPPMEEDEHGS